MEALSYIFGWGGAAVVLIAYFLVSNEKISPESRGYQYMNLFGALGIAWNTVTQAAWPSFAVNFVWALIALFALYSLYKKRNPLPQEAEKEEE